MSKIRNDIISLLPDGDYTDTYIDMWEALINEAVANERNRCIAIANKTITARCKTKEYRLEISKENK